MKITLRKPKKAESVTNLRVPGEEVVLNNVVKFRSQQKQYSQLGDFLIYDIETGEVEARREKFVEIHVEGV